MMSIIESKLLRYYPSNAKDVSMRQKIVLFYYLKSMNSLRFNHSSTFTSLSRQLFAFVILITIRCVFVTPPLPSSKLLVFFMLLFLAFTSANLQIIKREILSRFYFQFFIASSRFNLINPRNLLAVQALLNYSDPGDISDDGGSNLELNSFIHSDQNTFIENCA